MKSYLEFLECFASSWNCGYREKIPRIRRSIGWLATSRDPIFSSFGPFLPPRMNFDFTNKCASDRAKHVLQCITSKRLEGSSVADWKILTFPLTNVRIFNVTFFHICKFCVQSKCKNTLVQKYRNAQTIWTQDERDSSISGIIFILQNFGRLRSIPP